jgi:hypothetical protein
LFSLVLIVSPLTTHAHRLDEYLQASQITLSTNRIHIELRLTPGVDVADHVFALIDLDHNHQLSPDEQRAYAERVLHDLSLELDCRSLPLTLTSATFPTRSEMKTGDAAVRLDLFAETALNNTNQQLTFRNNHLPNLSVYQANAMVPNSNSIKIPNQQRDRLQHELTLNINITPATPDNTAAPVTFSWRFWAVIATSSVCLFALLLTPWTRLFSSFRHPDRSSRIEKRT